MATWNHNKLALSALILFLLLSIAGCGGETAGEPSVTTPPSSDGEDIIDAQISGSVGDGPVVGARIRVYTDAGVLIAESTSSGSADYNLAIKTKGKNFPLRVVADQGTDLVTGDAPDFELVSRITLPNARSISNLNPFGTLIYGMARKSGGVTDTRIENARLVVVDRYGFGLDPAIMDDPVTVPVDDNNVHLIVTTSETLGEMIRRTRDALITTGSTIDGDDVVDRLAADLTDGWIDGDGAAGRDPRTAAVANVASAAVLVQAMANRLHVYGVDATSAMDSAIRHVRPTSSVTVADVRIPATALEQTARALEAAMVVSTNTVIEQALAVVLDAEPGVAAATLAAALPAGIDVALEQATLAAAYAGSDEILAINAIGRGAPRDDTDPEPTPDPTPDPIPQPNPGNTAPTISGTPNTAAAVGTAWAFQPSAADADGDALTFSISNKPAWLRFDSATGRLSGTPASGNVGTHLHIVISVTDGEATTSLPAFSIAVSEAPTAPTGFARVSWTAPTERQAGNPLTTVDHYTIYYGRSISDLDQSVSVSGTLTSHEIEALGEGTWYFSVTATCDLGLESAGTDVVSKTIR